MATVTTAESLSIMQRTGIGRLVSLNGYYYRYDDATQTLYTWAGDSIKNYRATTIQDSFQDASYLDNLRVGEGL